MVANIAELILNNPQQTISIIITSIIGIILLYSSIEDLRSRTIRAVWVVLLYILVSLRSVFAGQLSIQSTYVFLFAFILFMGLAIFSRGQFGYGDALVLGALGLYYHTFTGFQTFLFTLAIVGIPWAIYWTWHYGKKQGYKNLINAFKKTISIDDAQPGMVLAKDCFMNGLTQKDIDKMKQAGSITIDVKQPFAFIPCIFIAFIITLILQAL